VFSVMFTFGIERFAVKFCFVLGRAKRACVPNVSSERINKNLNRRMVHITGQMSAESGATDDEIGYRPNCTPIVLKRTVEVLHWHEHKHSHPETCNGKSHTTHTYTYSLKWTEHDVDSASFDEQHGHTNPRRAIPIKSKTFYADTRVGAYRMSPEQLHKLKRFHVSELTPEAASAASALLRQPPDGYAFAGLRQGMRQTRIEGQATARGEAYWSSLYDAHATLPRAFLYVARAAAAEANNDGLGTAGDLRVSYDVVREGPVALAGVLQSGSFRAFNERDAHTARGLLTDQLLPSPAGTAGRDDGGPAATAGGCGGGFCAGSAWAVDRLIRLFMDSEAPAAVLLVEERAAGVASLFRDEDTKFHTRLAMMRGAAALLLWLAGYLVLSPVAALLSFLPVVGGVLQGVFGVAALLLAALLWATVAAVAWFASHPHGVMLLLLAEVPPPPAPPPPLRARVRPAPHRPLPYQSASRPAADPAAPRPRRSAADAPGGAGAGGEPVRARRAHRRGAARHVGAHRGPPGRRPGLGRHPAGGGLRPRHGARRGAGRGRPGPGGGGDPGPCGGGPLPPQRHPPQPRRRPVTRGAPSPRARPRLPAPGWGARCCRPLGRAARAMMPPPQPPPPPPFPRSHAPPSRGPSITRHHEAQPSRVGATVEGHAPTNVVTAGARPG
jgi:hypothetical protein